MFGKNPIRAPESGDGGTLNVVNIFPTLQGEGPFAGHPAVFVRLGGCNLACDFCDTEFEQFTSMQTGDILSQIQELALYADRRIMKRNLVVITGGEPLRQNIAPLCDILQMQGYRVQIETNGTLWRPEMPKEVQVVCSPKVSNGQYNSLRPDLLLRINALKFIISDSHPDYREVGEVGQTAAYAGGVNIPIYVQPMDEYDPAKNAANLARAAMLAQTQNYILSLQLHKLVGIE